MKKLLPLILGLITLVPNHISANEGDVIEIKYSGTTATVTIPATAAVVQSGSGSYVSLISATTTEEYIYRVSGTTTDGALTITGNYKLTLELNGTSITSKKGAAIDIESGKRIAVVLKDGTTNTLVDYASGAQDAAMYFKGHPEFEGGGTLRVTGNHKHGIYAKEYIQVKKTTGTITIVKAVNDGIHCGKAEQDKNFFQINGGVVNISNVGKDCIDTGDLGVIRVKGGTINANVTSAEGSGLKCDSIFYMSAGNLNINVKAQEAEGIRTNYDGQFTGGKVIITVASNGAKGIKSKDKADNTVSNGGMLHFAGTEFEIYAYGNDIKSGGVVTTNCRAVSADADITRSAGKITIYAYGDMEGAYNSDTKEVVTGGDYNLYRAPWNFYYGNYQLSMTSYVTPKVNGSAVTGSNNYAIGAFIGSSCVGVAVNNYLRIWSNSSSASKVTFKAYDYTNGKTLLLVPSKDVTFSYNSTISTAAAPIILTSGDVNADGTVNSSDVTRVAEIITGKQTDTKRVADVNGSGKTSVADVTALLRVILGK